MEPVRKKMLILRACGLTDEKQECDNIKSQAESYDIEVKDYCPNSNNELIDFVNKKEKFDYIYLSSHGSAMGFGNEAKTIYFSWYDFGMVLCNSDCMNEDCIILLSCCRGGLNQVAYDLFYCCNKISYIVGPRQSLYPYEMLISFNILLYNLENRHVDPIVACEKIKLGTDIRFKCFDRLETETEAGYIIRIREYENQAIDAANKARENEMQIIMDMLQKKEIVPFEIGDLSNKDGD
jgi:hypothetical protein